MYMPVENTCRVVTVSYASMECTERNALRELG